MSSGAADSWTKQLLAYIDSGMLAAGAPYPCPYLPGRLARSRGFRCPELPGDTYHQLMDRGFRRAGDVYYAMDCAACRACVPLRVPVASFQASRSQRRVWRRNTDIRLEVGPPQFGTDRWQLYQRYLAFQHPERSPSESATELQAWLYEGHADSREACYFLGNRLVAVSILDVATAAVSSVYHFFEPDCAHRSLGVFSVLAEIDWARTRGIPYYYLGFWIDGAPTMAYKANYGPHELLRDGRWQAAPAKPPPP